MVFILRKKKSIEKVSVTLGKYIKDLIRNPYSKWFSTSKFAKKYEVHPSTVTEQFQRLKKLGLIDYKKYKGIRLTKKGIVEGELLMWKHRILETYFSEEFGLTKEEACHEANRIDFYISNNIIEYMCKKNNHPTTCPCGNEISRRFCTEIHNEKIA